MITIENLVVYFGGVGVAASERPLLLAAIAATKGDRPFSGSRAVDDLSLSVPEGAILGLIGPNGAGKSTTMRVLATLVRPMRGRVLVGGIDVVRNPQLIRKLIGWVPDSFGVYDGLTCADYLRFFASINGVDGRATGPVVRDVLDLVDLSRKADDPVEHLSRGMKQRLSIARALLHDPALLLLDEPTEGLAPVIVQQIGRTIAELKAQGFTILLVEQNFRFAA
nr:ABC transporter ATP-binding protein [Planctomycetota bacterium]